MPTTSTSRDSRLPSANEGSLEVYSLSAVDLTSFGRLQDLLLYQLSGRKDGQAVLLLCEHPPTISMGREASHAQLAETTEDLQKNYIPVRWQNRGGKACLHQPGQLSVCPLFPYKRRGVGLYEFSNRLESLLLDVCRELKVEAERKSVGEGLWTPSGQIAWTGLAARWGLTFQGCFLNVDNDLELARLVTNDQNSNNISSLAMRRSRPISMATVRESVIRHFAQAFGYDEVHHYSSHPALSRSKQTVHAYARHS
ncbi:lipoyl protein ligase domain-containing protein [Lacunimicrobium album]